MFNLKIHTKCPFFKRVDFIHKRKLGVTPDCIKSEEINLLKKHQHLLQKLMVNLGRLALSRFDVNYMQRQKVHLQCHSMQ